MSTADIAVEARAAIDMLAEKFSDEPEKFMGAILGYGVGLASRLGINADEVCTLVRGWMGESEEKGKLS